MLFCHSILPIFIMIYYRGNMSFCYSILLIPLCYIIESQLCRSVTQFYPYPICYTIERRQARFVTQLHPYSLCYIIERQLCRSVTQFFPYPLY